MIDYWSSLKEWTQPDGLIVPRGRSPKPDSTGNGLLYLALAHVCAVLNRFPLKSVEYSAIVRSCYEGEWSGILNRSPTKKGDQTGWDDYVGVAAACKIMDMQHLAWVSLNAGNVRRFILFKWFFKNNKPGQFWLFSKDTWKAWFGRRPSVISHLQICSGVWPNALRILWQSLNMLRVSLISMGRSHDAVILTYLQVLSWEQHWCRPWHVKYASALFKKRLKSKYGDFGAVLRHRLDADHPIVLNWPKAV